MMTAADSSTDTVNMAASSSSSAHYQHSLYTAPSTPPVLSAPSTPTNNNKMHNNKNASLYTPQSLDFSSMGYRDNRSVHRPDSPTDEVTSTDPFEHLPSPISPSAVANQFSYDDDRIQNDLLDEICSDIGIKDSMELDFLDFDDISNTGGFSDLEPTSTTNPDQMNKSQFSMHQQSRGQSSYNSYQGHGYTLDSTDELQNTNIMLEQHGGGKPQTPSTQSQYMHNMSKVPNMTSAMTSSVYSNSVTSQHQHAMQQQQNVHANYVTSSSCASNNKLEMQAYSPSNSVSRMPQRHMPGSAPQSPRYSNNGDAMSASQDNMNYQQRQFKPTSLQFHDKPPGSQVVQSGMPSPSMPQSSQNRPVSNLPPHMKSETMQMRGGGGCYSGKPETNGVRMLNSPVDLGYSSSDMASVSSYDSGKNSGSGKPLHCQGNVPHNNYSNNYGLANSRSGSRENIVSSSEQLAGGVVGQPYPGGHDPGGCKPSTIVLSTPADLIQHMKQQYKLNQKSDPLHCSSAMSSPAKHMATASRHMMPAYQGQPQHPHMHQQQQHMQDSMNMRPPSGPPPPQTGVARTQSPSQLHGNMPMQHPHMHNAMPQSHSQQQQQPCMESATYPHQQQQHQQQQHQQQQHSMQHNQSQMSAQHMYPTNPHLQPQQQPNGMQMPVRNNALPAMAGQPYGQDMTSDLGHSSLPLSHNSMQQQQQSHCHKILSKPGQGQRAEYSPYARNSNSANMQMHGMNQYGMQAAKRQRMAMQPPGSPHKAQQGMQSLAGTGSLAFNPSMSETQFDSQLEARLQQQLDQGLMGMDDDQVISYTQKAMFRPINPATMKAGASMRAMPLPDNRQMMHNQGQMPGGYNMHNPAGSCNMPGQHPADGGNMLRSAATSGEKMGFIQQLVTDRSSAFRSHPLFPLLRDLIIADMNFHTPTFPFQLISNLPSDFNRLLQNYLQRNPPAGNYQSNQAIENVMMDALRFAHQALIEKITAKKEQEQLMQPKPINAIEDFCARFDRAVRNSLNKGQVPTNSSSPGKMLIAPSRLSHNFQRPASAINPHRMFDIPDTCSESSVTSTRSAGSFSSETGVKKHPVLPKESVSVMLDWLREHEDNPYPNDDEKEMLIRRTKLTINQINYWFTNARRRILPKWREQKQAQARQQASSNTTSTPSKGDNTPTSTHTTDSLKETDLKKDILKSSCDDDLKKTNSTANQVKPIHETVL